MSQISTAIVVCAALLAATVVVHSCTVMVSSNYNSYNDAMRACTDRGASFVPTSGGSYNCIQGAREPNK